MNAPNFGNICEDPQDGILANRLAIWMAKIENAISLNKLELVIEKCDKITYENKIEPYLYYPHDSHTLALIVVIVDDLHQLTTEIERVETIDVNLYLRNWYYLLKNAICSHPDAVAYHLNK